MRRSWRKPRQDLKVNSNSSTSFWWYIFMVIKLRWDSTVYYSQKTQSFTQFFIFFSYRDIRLVFTDKQKLILPRPSPYPILSPVLFSSVSVIMIEAVALPCGSDSLFIWQYSVIFLLSSVNWSFRYFRAFSELKM